MMTKLFNTSFELKLRVLLILAEAKYNPLSIDMIVATDFITVYGAEFGISNENLHGNNRFMFGEITKRRSVIQDAVRDLVLDALVDVDLRKGYRYCITQSGRDFIGKMQSTYAKAYRAVVKSSLIYIGNRSEQEVLREFQMRALEEQ